MPYLYERVVCDGAPPRATGVALRPAPAIHLKIIQTIIPAGLRGLTRSFLSAWE